jgi:hypothetical protein
MLTEKMLILKDSDREGFGIWLRNLVRGDKDVHAAYIKECIKWMDQNHNQLIDLYKRSHGHIKDVDLWATNCFYFYRYNQYRADLLEEISQLERMMQSCGN